MDATALDRLTRLAARLLGTAHAQVSLMTDEQVVASQFGDEQDPTAGPALDSLCLQTMLLGAPLVVVDAVADAQIAHLAPVRLGRVGAYLGVPLINAEGTRLGTLCVFAPRPRSWESDDVAMLAEVAESVVVELELRALTAESGATAARLGLALSAAAMGSFDLDLARSALVLDARLAEQVGLPPQASTRLTDAATLVHPDDLPRVIEALAAARSTGTSWSPSSG